MDLEAEDKEGEVVEATKKDNAPEGIEDNDADDDIVGALSYPLHIPRSYSSRRVIPGVIKCHTLGRSTRGKAVVKL